MTDQTANTADETPVPQWMPEGDLDWYTLDEVGPKDSVLELMLDLTFGEDDVTTDTFMGLTVTTNGALVSGIVISSKAWIAALADQFQQAGEADRITDGLKELLDARHGSSAEESNRRRTAELPNRARRHLHMRDVRIGTGTNTTGMALWRGSLADVTGWALGSWNGSK